MRLNARRHATLVLRRSHEVAQQVATRLVRWAEETPRRPAGVRCTRPPASLANGDEARGAATGHVLYRQVSLARDLHRRRHAAVGGAPLARGRLPRAAGWS